MGNTIIFKASSVVENDKQEIISKKMCNNSFILRRLPITVRDFIALD